MSGALEVKEVAEVSDSTVIITPKMLRAQGACAEGMQWVNKNLPEGAEYGAFVRALEADGRRDWAGWLIDKFGMVVLPSKWRVNEILEATDPKNVKADVSSGHSAKIGSSGHSAKIGSSGHYAQIGSSGDSAQIGSSGNSAQIGSSGDYAQIGSSGNSAKIGSSGHSAQIGSSGGSAQIGSSGHSAKIGSSGYSAQIGSSGDSAQIGSSGNSAQIGSSGDYAQIGSSGNSAKIGSSGHYAKIGSSGKKSIIAAVGYNSIAKAGEDGCIALSWWDEKARRPRLAVGYVGEGLKAGVWYQVQEGTFVEVAHRIGEAS